MCRITLAALIEKAADASRSVSFRFRHGPRDVHVAAIAEDSRRVRAGSLFIARPGGTADGRAFIDDAVLRGAMAVLSDDSANVPTTATFVATDDVPHAAAILAEAFHDQPSRQLELVGVTGTNGKTTVAHLVHQLLTARGSRCGLIGTVQIDDGVSKSPSNLTTPSAIDLSALLRRMVDAGCDACAMEVSSHALHQKRVAGLDFNIAIFTNLSGDHLDYHGSMDEYAASKAILFESLPADGVAIVNVDDPYWRRMVLRCPARVLRCSLDDPSMECYAEASRRVSRRADASRRVLATGDPLTVLRGPWGEIDVHLPLIGNHNVMNALQAAAAAHALGMSDEQIRSALSNCTAPPGRLEPVTPRDHPFSVFVDYAHTDDALDNVLRAVKPLVPEGGRLRVVFGCGGDRDRTKRPRMARAAWRWADEVIITSDNPRTEDPEAIISEVLTGVPVERIAQTLCITDRRKAIHEAIIRAEENDIVIIAGKGHEDDQIIGTQKRPFDDRIIAVEALAEASRRVSGSATGDLGEPRKAVRA